MAHFPDAENGFTTTTSGSVASGAATVGLNSVAGYTNGQPAVFVIDPTDATKKQTFTGVIDTSGSQVTGVKWTAGTNQPHLLGATVVDYATATHIAMMSKGILVQHSQDGTHHDITSTNGNITNLTVTNLTVGSQTPSADWTATTVPNTVIYNGNRSYDMVFNATDLTGTIQPGTRLRTTRAVAAPTQSTSLNGTNQYWVKTSPNKLTFTDDFVVSAWVKLTSYPSGNADILSRWNGTNGWVLRMSNTGQLDLFGNNGGPTNFSEVVSYQTVPLNKWVHITAQLDMSSFTATPTTSYMMLDGVDIPVKVNRGGTNPTVLVQAGNLEIGSSNGGAQPFGGKIAQVAIYNNKVTQANIRATVSQGLTGTETSLASAYSFNGVTTDLNTTTPNDLVAGAGSPVATNADSPFGGQANGTISGTLDYGIAQVTTFSTNTTITVQVPEGCTIPTSSGAISAVSYSSAGAPYGFPKEEGKWSIKSINKVDRTFSIVSSTPYYNCYPALSITVPVGKWTPRLFTSIELGGSTAAATFGRIVVTTESLAVDASTTNDALFLKDMVGRFGSTSGTIVFTAPAMFNGEQIRSDTQSKLSTVVRVEAAGGSYQTRHYGDSISSASYIELKNAYL